MMLTGCVALLVGSTIAGAIGDTDTIFGVGVCTHFRSPDGN
jgi:hypothetical protein